MKQFEFETFVNEDATLKIPTEIAEKIERDRPVRVVVIVQDTDDDRQWAELTAEQFLQGYSEIDAIYDEVSSG